MRLKLGRRGDPLVLGAPLATFRMAGDSLSLTGFETQFAEHVRNAREHGAGHPVAVGLNRAASRAMVLAYRPLRRGRRRSSRSCRAVAVETRATVRAHDDERYRSRGEPGV